MARSQGDSYKTWTDHSLNAYKARLNAKLQKLIDHREKWYKAGCGWVLAEEYNRMINPNGSWKWNGWEVEAHEYIIRVFPEECVTVVNGMPVAIGWSQVVLAVDDDKDKANALFKKGVELAKELKTWHPQEANNGIYIDYEGRKPSAVITFHWDGDTYYYSLVIDGEQIMNAYNRDELVEEAEKRGAVLEETHTP